jgi:2-polyprenyl-3-methyl-5-hydroxy-6-metoxy-1,4-benzoquinol methylase
MLVYDDVVDRMKILFQDRYSSQKLRGLDPDIFHSYIQNLIASDDSAKEGYLDQSKQRDLSIRFHWGHHHDFGNGVIYEGKMGWRHVNILARFVCDYGMSFDLSGKRVLDIGVWTGGTSLLLAAMGAEVLAVEEVAKYSDTVNYLANAFGIQDRLKCIPRSLYDVLPMFADYFDYIVYSGVIYHVSDPLLSLRLVFSALMDDGKVFLETYGFNHSDCVCRYEGPSIVHNGSKEFLDRGGWNYYIPSPKCLDTWCRDAGFQVVHIGDVDSSSRLLGVARRTQFGDFCRAGLSRPSIR